MIKKKIKKKTDASKPIFTESNAGCGSAAETDNSNRVWFLFGKTINIGNYESIKIEVGRGRTIRHDETPAEALEVVRESVLEDSLSIIDMVEETLK